MNKYTVEHGSIIGTQTNEFALRRAESRRGTNAENVARRALGAPEARLVYSDEHDLPDVFARDADFPPEGHGIPMGGIPAVRVIRIA